MRLIDVHILTPLWGLWLFCMKYYKRFCCFRIIGSIVFTPIYKIGHIYAKKQDIKSHLGSYDVAHYSARFDTFMKALVSLDSNLQFRVFSYNRLIRICRLSQNRS